MGLAAAAATAAAAASAPSSTKSVAADDAAAGAPSKTHEFLWTSTVEPHAARRKAILAAHGDEVRKLYGYDVSTAVQVGRMKMERQSFDRSCDEPSSAVALPRRSQKRLSLCPPFGASALSGRLFLLSFLLLRRWPGRAEALRCFVGAATREMREKKRDEEVVFETDDEQERRRTSERRPTTRRGGGPTAKKKKKSSGLARPASRCRRAPRAAPRHRDDISPRVEAKRKARKGETGASEAKGRDRGGTKKGSAFARAPLSFLDLNLSRDDLSHRFSFLSSSLLQNHHHPPPTTTINNRSSPSWPSPSPRPSSSATPPGGRCGSPPTPSAAPPRKTSFARSTSCRTFWRSRGRCSTGCCRSRPTARWSCRWRRRSASTTRSTTRTW